MFRVRAARMPPQSASAFRHAWHERLVKIQGYVRVKCGKRFPRDRSGVPSLAGLPGRVMACRRENGLFLDGAFKGGLSGVWRYVGRGFPRPGLHTRPATAARSDAPRNPASAPGGRPSFLLRQERRQRRRPGFTGHSLGRMTPLRCSQRAAGAELAQRAQTAAPDFPARCSAARRFRRAYRGAPSLSGNRQGH